MMPARKRPRSPGIGARAGARPARYRALVSNERGPLKTHETREHAGCDHIAGDASGYERVIRGDDRFTAVLTGSTAAIANVGSSTSAKA
jgi:hypothetical protein